MLATTLNHFSIKLKNSNLWLLAENRIEEGEQRANRGRIEQKANRMEGEQNGRREQSGDYKKEKFEITYR